MCCSLTLRRVLLYFHSTVFSLHAFLPFSPSQLPLSSGNPALDAARARFLRALLDNDPRPDSQQSSMHSSPMKVVSDAVVIHDIPVAAVAQSGEFGGKSRSSPSATRGD
jgi:hypothetical protein